MNPDSTETAQRALKQAGVPVTMRRLHVWEVVSEAAQPVEATEIKRRLIQRDADMPLSSVYTALKRLTQAGVFATHEVAGTALYSLASRDFSQRIVSLENEQEHWYADAELRQAIEAFCARHGFDLADYTLLARARPSGASARSRRRG